MGTDAWVGGAQEFADGSPGALAVEAGFEERVRAQAVRAVIGYARAFPGRVEAGHLVGAVGQQDLAVDVGRNAAHGVVGRGLDRHRVVDHVDAQEVQGQLPDLGQAFQDGVAAEVAEVENDGVFALPAPAFVDLLLNRPGHDVARCELHAIGA